MGDLIAFRPSSNPGRLDGATAPSREAHILFFTGVRYKRETESNPIAAEHEAPPKGGMDGTGGGRRKRRG
jgi:hypothetical protein